MSTNECVRVIVRFRPTNKSEQRLAREGEPWRTLQSTDKGVIMNQNQLSLYGIQEHGANNITFKKRKEIFTFDALLAQNTTQVEAFEKVAQQTCDEIMQGYNGTIFVYGQSGSGKTHTMYGPEEKKDSMDITSMGVIPQSCAYIFSILNNKDHPLVQGMLSYKVECEFIEVYNETLKDLLDLNNTPQIRELCINSHKDEWRVIVRNLQRRQVRNLGEVLKAIRVASSNRTVRGTNLNATSSRSHMVMKLIVKIETADGIRTGIGNFSDLAGSEKIKKTKATGQGLEEAKNILKSLSTLSRVIDALVKNKLPPFKDSKLTWMLKDSLGANCKTALLIACSPHVFNRDETVRSLRFGKLCRSVQNKAKINAIRTKAQLIAENEELKERIQKLKLGKSGKSEYIMVDDAKSIEKEKQKLNTRIQELEHANQSLSDQITGNNQEKASADEQLMRINNEFDELKNKMEQLMLEMNEKDNSIESYEKQVTNLNALKERLTEQTNNLTTISKKLNQTNNDLNVENERLQNSNKQQSDLVQKLKQQHQKEQEEQKSLQDKWKSALDSKKSQFSQQEVKLSQTIESLQLQMKQSSEAQQSMERDMNSMNEALKKREHDTHQLEDEKRKIINDLKEEKDKNVTVSAENEQLKIQIEELKSQLRQQKIQNEGFDLKLQTVKDQHFNETQEQKSIMQQLEFDLENRFNELQLKENHIKEMQKDHQREVKNLRHEMEALMNLNEQLQEENKTASDVMHVQKKQISKHSRDTSVIQQQLNELQSHYAHVIQEQVQIQIEADHNLARKIQEEEAAEYMIQHKKRLNQQSQRKNKKKSHDVDSDSEPELLPAHGVTAGGHFEQIVNKYAPKHMKKTDTESEGDSDDDKKTDTESEEDSDEDVEEQKKAMFGALITRREDERKERKRNLKEEWQKKQQELEALQVQANIDRDLAENIHNKQQEKQVQHEWMREMEKARQRELEEARRREHIAKHYISADKIPETSGFVADKDYLSKNKKKRKQRQWKQIEDEQNEFEDPEDGMGLIIYDNEYASDEDQY